MKFIVNSILGAVLLMNLSLNADITVRNTSDEDLEYQFATDNWTSANKWVGDPNAYSISKKSTIKVSVPKDGKQLFVGYDLQKSPDDLKNKYKKINISAKVSDGSVYVITKTPEMSWPIISKQ
jgi:hypothetical protein